MLKNSILFILSSSKTALEYEVACMDITPPSKYIEICGLRFVDLNLTLRVFLRVLWFSSLCKFDFHAKI